MNVAECMAIGCRSSLREWFQRLTFEWGWMKPFPASFQQALLLQGIAVRVDSAAVSIFVVILVELTNTVFVNSTKKTINIETAVLSNLEATHDGTSCRQRGRLNICSYIG